MVQKLHRMTNIMKTIINYLHHFTLTVQDWLLHFNLSNVRKLRGNKPKHDVPTCHILQPRITHCDYLKNFKYLMDFLQTLLDFLFTTGDISQTHVYTIYWLQDISSTFTTFTILWVINSLYSHFSILVTSEKTSMILCLTILSTYDLSNYIFLAFFLQDQSCKSIIILQIVKALTSLFK